jgi:hypothetical protein
MVIGPLLPAGAVMATLSKTRLLREVNIDLPTCIVIAAGSDGIAAAIVNWPSDDASAESSSRRSRASVLGRRGRDRFGRRLTATWQDFRSRQRSEYSDIRGSLRDEHNHQSICPALVPRFRFFYAQRWEYLMNLTHNLPKATGGSDELVASSPIRQSPQLGRSSARRGIRASPARHNRRGRTPRYSKIRVTIRYERRPTVMYELLRLSLL